jgi:DNA-binding Lrp family transcriptional regulator
MEIAYVLIQCDLGSEEQIINEIMKISEVKEVRGTYGIYDVFCKVQTDNKETLDKIITNKIRRIPKIRSTITLHFIPSQGGK